MTGTVLALALVAVATEEPAAVVGQTPTLSIDPCAAVDEQTVRQVMEIEIQGAPDVPASVSVGCTATGLEIRARPWTPPANEGVRVIQLGPVSWDASPAARQARSRELALAIAELIRRQDGGPAAIEAVPPPGPPAPAATEVAASPVPTEKGPAEARWQIGALSALEYFSGGSSLAGGDVLFRSRLAGRLVAELKVGGRFRPSEDLPGSRLTVRAGVAALGVGVATWSRNQTVGAVVVLRAQGYLVQYTAAALDGEARASLAAFSLAVEPSLLVAVTSWFSLEATAAFGFLPHGIDLRVQGARRGGVSGLCVSGNLGGVFTF